MMCLGPRQEGVCVFGAVELKSAAFDTVDHGHLKARMERAFGVS